MMHMIYYKLYEIIINIIIHNPWVLMNILFNIIYVFIIFLIYEINIKCLKKSSQYFLSLGLCIINLTNVVKYYYNCTPSCCENLT